MASTPQFVFTLWDLCLSPFPAGSWQTYMFVGISVWTLEFFNLGFWIFKFCFCILGIWDDLDFEILNLWFCGVWFLDFFWAYFSSIFSSLIEISKRQTFMSRTLIFFWWFLFYRLHILLAMLILHFFLPVTELELHRKYFQKQGVGHPIIAYTQYFRPSTTNFFDTLFPTNSKLEFRDTNCNCSAQGI